MFVIFMTSCGIYSFTGTSIQPDVKTVNIEYFEYKALKVNPTLANDLSGFTWCTPSSVFELKICGVTL